MNNLEGIEQIQGDDQVEALRLILEREQNHSVTYGEALEVAEALICFFEVMAEETEPEQEPVEQGTQQTLGV